MKTKSVEFLKEPRLLEYRMRVGTISTVLGFGVFFLVAAASLERDATAQSSSGNAKLTKQLLGKLNAPLNRIKKTNQSIIDTRTNK